MIDEKGLISRHRLLSVFGDYLEAFEVKDCYVIHPENAAKVGDLFNSVEFEYSLEGFTKQAELESLTNAERSTDQKVVED